VIVSTDSTRAFSSVSKIGLEVGDAERVAQVDEQQIAVVALAVQPTRETHRLARMVFAQFAAIVGSVRMHDGSRNLLVFQGVQARANGHGTRVCVKGRCFVIAGAGGL
jgi:hypothetical protein